MTMKGLLLSVAFSSFDFANGHSHGHDSHHHSHSHDISISTGFVSKFQHLFPFASRYNALLAALYISILPCALVLILPGFKRGGTKMVRLMVPFALGGVLGDILLHVLPELYIESSNHGEVGYGILWGFIGFMIIDRSLRIIHMGNGTNEYGHSHSHSHSHIQASKINGDKNLRDSKKNDITNEKTDTTAENESLKVSAYLNMVSEFIHKLTDGVALASSFYSSRHVGIMSFIAIMLHEVPHELGDFAIKLSSGMSFKQSIETEIVTCIGALVGTGIGCLINEMGESYAYTSPSGMNWSTQILTMSCGGLLYSSTVGVVPELLQVNSKSKLRELITTIIQLGCTLLGFYLMAVVE